MKEKVTVYVTGFYNHDGKWRAFVSDTPPNDLGKPFYRYDLIVPDEVVGLFQHEAEAEDGQS